MLAVLAAACGGSGDDTVSNGGPAPAPTDQTNNGNTGAGQATLTVGDQSWSFDGVYCAFTQAESRNARVSFSSGAFGEVDGTRVQLDASIQDTQEQGRYEGQGVIHSVTLNDVEDFENPSIAWESTSGFITSSETVFAVSGKKVSVQASFDNGLTGELESIIGTLEMTCP